MLNVIKSERIELDAHDLELINKRRDRRRKRQEHEIITWRCCYEK